MTLVDSFFDPSEPLQFLRSPTAEDILIKCGHRGAQLFESLETIFGENSILEKIQALIRQNSYRTYSLEAFLTLLKSNIVDGIDLSQVSNTYTHLTLDNKLIYDNITLLL